MKIILVTYGSRGDVQPMLALTLALQDAGHDVLLIGPPEKEAWAQQLRCPYAPLGANVTAVIDGMKNVMSISSILRFISLIRKQLRVQFDTLPQLISGADLVLGASLTFGLPSVAEAMNIPYRYIAFTPQLLVSGAHPCVWFKTQRLPTWINKMSWQLTRAMDRFNMTAQLNFLRKSLGLKPVDDVWKHLLGKEVIVACDEALVPVPGDIDVGYCQTGYFHLQYPKIGCFNRDASALKTKVERFIEGGRPLVYVGFGSMPRKDQLRGLPIIVSTLRSIGVRAVVGKFWHDPTGYEAQSDLFMLKHYPHLDLFPRMDAVIHHGGAGTTATCLASGVPQVIVPHILDQYYHAHQIYKSNLGPSPIWREHLTKKKLFRSLTTALEDQCIKENAQRVGSQLDIQEGLKKGVEYIESLFDCRSISIGK